MNRFVRVLAFVDDLTLIIRSDQEIDAVMGMLENFSKFAGIKLNLRNSGFLRFNTCAIGPQKITEKDELKILGIFIGTNYRKVVETNYRKVIQAINATIQAHMSRRLNLLEKVVVLNDSTPLPRISSSRMPLTRMPLP